MPLRMRLSEAGAFAFGCARRVPQPTPFRVGVSLSLLGGNGPACDSRVRTFALLTDPLQSYCVGLKITPRISIKSHRKDLLHFAVASVTFQSRLLGLGVP
jgi:hypothetical protein